MIKEVQFEEGDIIAFGCNLDNPPIIGILRSTDGIHHDDYFNVGTALDSTGWTCTNMRLATKEEEQKLFKELAIKGKRWNAKNKCIEDIPELHQFILNQAVLVRSGVSYWDIANFIDYRGDLDYPYITNRGGYKECIDYANNKELYAI